MNVIVSVLAFLIGLASITTGAALVAIPAGFIVGGAGCVLCAVLLVSSDEEA